MMEVKALRDGVSSAIPAGFKKFVIKCDNQIVIEALKGKSRSLGKYPTLLQGCAGG